jgi:hypothetical protein
MKRLEIAAAGVYELQLFKVCNRAGHSGRYVARGMMFQPSPQETCSNRSHGRRHEKQEEA